ncbi:MAG: FliO/MopB family protein [bacterium]
MNKSDKKFKAIIKFYSFIFTAAFVSVFFSCIFSNISYGALTNENLSLKNIYVSKNKDSYLIWFKFNQKPEGIIKKFGLNGYSIELTFKNAQSGIGSKFIKFHNNRLFKAVEIMPVNNSGLNAVIYFHKNIKINKKDAYATFYENYFIVKINHAFSEDLFKNIGKKSSAPAATLQIKSNFNNAKPQKNKISSLKTASKTSGNNAPFLLKHTPKLNMSFEIIKTAVYLSLIIGLIYAVYFLMNKFKNRVSVKEKLNNLKIVSSISLGNKKSILLIEVNREFFLVGVSQSNIQVIGHFKDKTVDAENALSKFAADTGGIGGDINANTYAIPEAGAYRSNISMPAGDAAFQQNPSPAIKSYGKFADAMREQVGNYGDVNEPARKIRAGQPQDTNIAAQPDIFKVKNINQAKFKSKADNVFFDIEERLKGLMESNGKDFTRSEASNTKKF